MTGNNIIGIIQQYHLEDSTITSGFNSIKAEYKNHKEERLVISINPDYDRIFIFFERVKKDNGDGTYEYEVINKLNLKDIERIKKEYNLKAV